MGKTSAGQDFPKEALPRKGVTSCREGLDDVEVVAVLEVFEVEAGGEMDEEVKRLAQGDNLCLGRLIAKTQLGCWLDHTSS